MVHRNEQQSNIFSRMVEKSIILITLIALAISFVILFLIIFYLFSSFSSSFSFSSKPKTKTYQLTEIDLSSSNHSSHSFVTLPENIFVDPETPLSYFNKETSSSFFITHFGSSTSSSSNTEFKCTGICTCHSTERRSMISSSTLTKPLYVLLTTFSLTLALKIAKISFENECLQLCETTSSSSPIDVEIFECENTETKKKEVEFPSKKIFKCQGTCFCWLNYNPELLRGIHGVSEFHKLGKEKIGGECERLTVEKEIVLDEKSEIALQHGTPEFFVAKYQFGWRNLDPFCKQSSMLKLEWFPEEIQEMEERQLEQYKRWVARSPKEVQDYEEFMRNRPYCIGISKPFYEEEGSEYDPRLTKLGNIECIKMMHRSL